MSQAQPEQDIIVVGGGVIGSCLARALCELGSRGDPCSASPAHGGDPASSAPRPPRVLLLERCEVAAAASGRAGGFLARDWSAGALGSLSFDLHAQLAQQYGGAARWGYRRLSALSVAAGGGGSRRRSAGGVVAAAPWIDGAMKGAPVEVLATEETAAQVTPVRALLRGR